MTSSLHFRERLLVRLDAATLSGSSQSATSPLSDREIAQLEQYFDLLRHWNRKINLTALPLDDLGDATIDRLFVEPLSAARLFGSEPLRWTDLGSGGGSPAVPLKVACPAAILTMVESRSRKVAFLREVARELGLPDVAVLGMRAEALGTEPIEPFDLITIRAVRLDAAFVGVVHRQLAADGRLLLFTPADSPTNFHGFSQVNELPLETTSSRVVVLRKS